MSSMTAPHYLLLSETQLDESGLTGGWSFVLERMDGSQRIEVADWEPDVKGERLKLLAVVRGLEALEQPSKVTLITPSRFIGRGIRSGLTQWKEDHWKWERFGVMTDIKNADLWKRIDRAREFHRIDCRVWNFSQLFSRTPRPRSAIAPAPTESASASPRIKSRGHVQPAAFQLPSWTDIAANVANKIIPVKNHQVYGCA